MSTPKENFLRLMRNDNPKWLGDPWSCFNQNRPFRPVTFDAVALSLGGPQPGQMHVKNGWGVELDWPAGAPGQVPYITEENKVIKDITHWRDFFEFPQLDVLPWEAVDTSAFDRENYLVMAGTFTGMFEFSHYMMGFMDALTNYLIEPDYMYELLSAYTDWKIKAIGLTIDHLKPDVIHSHDDWGNKKALFLNPETWRDILKPLYKRFYGYIKSRGVLVQHHNDSVSHEICEDMVDVGIDMWQGVIPQNDIPGIIRRTEGRLCVMGGIDSARIDLPNAKEEEVRAEVRRAIDEYMPLGSFIPCVPNIIPIYPQVEEWINDEMTVYGTKYAAEHF